MTLAAFAKQLDVFVKQLGPESAKLVQRETARIVKETRQNSPLAPAYRINIGSRRDQILDSLLPDLGLKPDEPVVLLFDHRREAVEQIWFDLRQNSPVVTGDYQNDFSIYVDGQEIGELKYGQRLVRPGADVEIINKSPYARKLEVGKNADGSPFVVQVPPGMVERVASKSAQRRWGKIARIYFTYMDISDAYVLQGSRAGTKYVNNLGKLVKRSNAADRRKGSRMRYPTIVLEEPNYGLR